MCRNSSAAEISLPTKIRVRGAPTPSLLRPRWVGRVLIASLALIIARVDGAEVPAKGSAAALQATHERLRDKLADNQFKLPLYLESSQHSGELRGDIHAVVDYPFATVSTASKGAAQWCDILLLHLNVKYSRVSEDQQGKRLSVYIGRKNYQELDAAYLVEFGYDVAPEAPDYLQVVLHAQKGPVGTKDYRIMLEATPLEGGKTFVHFSYSFSSGFAARMATQAYFSTLGSAKVGFTVVGSQPDGKPIYVDDLRAASERNTMRYYLAIEAYLGALSAPPTEQLEKRLHSWFALTERYALQLHEETEAEYLEMKIKEYHRQQTER